MNKLIEHQEIFGYMFGQMQESGGNSGQQNNGKSDQELDDNDSESVNVSKQINSQMSREQFIDLINSNKMLYVKKQILLRIDNEVILVKNTNSQKTKQIEQKIIERQKKIEKQSEENLLVEQSIIKEELRCSKLVMRNYEMFSKGYKERKRVMQRRVSEGSESAFNLESNMTV